VAEDVEDEEDVSLLELLLLSPLLVALLSLLLSELLSLLLVSFLLPEDA